MNFRGLLFQFQSYIMIVRRKFMGLLAFYFTITLAISFLCSFLEAVFLSIPPTFIGVLKKRKSRYSLLLGKQKENFGRSISAILTVNTIANTIGAALVGAQALKIYDSKWMAIISVVLTLFILVFSEIIPKTLGANHWRKFAGFAAYIIRFFEWVSLPIVVILEKVAKFISKNSKYKKITREELFQAAELGQEEGTLLEKEGRVIRNVLQLDKFYVKDIMTPASVVNSLDENLSIAEVMENKASTLFSRIPLYNTDKSNIIGLVLRHKIFTEASQDNYDKQLKELKTEVNWVSQDDSVANVLDKFIKSREHLFAVYDVSYRFVGLVTLEDSIETLLGVEIVDEYDFVDDMRQLAMQRSSAGESPFKASQVNSDKSALKNIIYLSKKMKSKQKL